VRTEAGFTLVEMLAALAVIGVVALLLAGGRPPGPPRLAMEVERVAATLRHARGEAMARGVSLAARFEAERLAVPALGLSEPVASRVLALPEETPLGTIVFSPEGRTKVAAFRLEREREGRTVEIDPLTGRIHVPR
jgi:prepilin-type N-terminal cleavage/methylation domain-containing protein